MLVDVQLSEPELYLPPVFNVPELSSPPHIIMLLSVQAAVCSALPVGAFVVEVAIQLSASGLYLAPVFKRGKGVGVGVGGETGPGLFSRPLFSCTIVSDPPQTIISVPVQTAV